MAEVYRYKGKLYVIRPWLGGEGAFVVGNNGRERITQWSADVIRTLGKGVTGFSPDERYESYRRNGTPSFSHVPQ